MRSILKCLPFVALLAAPLAAQSTTLITANAAGDPCNNNSFIPCLTDNGRFLLFGTRATDFVAGDLSALLEPFVVDLKKHTVTRVAVNDAGDPGNGVSNGWGTSSNGRFAVFDSGSTNLVPADTNATTDVFVRDLKLGLTTRVSMTSDGNEADGASEFPRISSNGRFVAFQSAATNLVPGDANGKIDIFLTDLKTGQVELISVATDGTPADDDCTRPTVSTNGRWVAFASQAATLVPNDTNAKYDVFVRDRKLGTTTRVSEDAAGGQLTGTNGAFNGFLSANGRYVAIVTDAPEIDPLDLNGVGDVYVRDLKKGTIERVSIGFDGADANGVSCNSTDSLWISGSGRWIAFFSSASNLVETDPNVGVGDVFVRDRVKGKTVLASLTFDDLGADANCNECTVSGNGKRVGFSSTASNLTATAGNGPVGSRDIYLRDLKH